MEVTSLQALNNRAANDDVVRIGDKLLVAEGTRDVAGQLTVSETAATDSDIFHVVRKGETPVKIATSYGITVAKLLASNDLTRQSIIRPGQRFRIPRQ